jgi:hypothetical protein
MNEKSTSVSNLKSNFLIVSDLPLKDKPEAGVQANEKSPFTADRAVPYSRHGKVKATT